MSIITRDELYARWERFESEAKEELALLDGSPDYDNVTHERQSRAAYALLHHLEEIGNADTKSLIWEFYGRWAKIIR